MMTNKPSRPVWADFADLLISRLQADADARVQSKTGIDLDKEEFDDPLDLYHNDAEGRVADNGPPPKRNPFDDVAGRYTSDNPEDRFEEDAGLGGHLGAATIRPPADIHPRELMLTLRLAATFENEDAASQMCRPGAVTVLTGVRPRDFDRVAGLIKHHFLPEGKDVARGSPGAGPNTLITMWPDPSGQADDIPSYSLPKFERSFEDKLEAKQPILVLLPPGMTLASGLTRAIARQKLLAAYSRDLLLAHLRVSHATSGAIDETALSAILPSDGALSALSSATVMLALRAPSACEVAEQIRTAVAAEDGPRLEDMTGTSEALVLARRLVNDLQRWREGTLRWSEMTHSLLLYGAPGTGKSYLARAVGQSARANFIQASFAEWQAAGHLGHMLAAMRASFAEAVAVRPAVLFIDEIDSAGSRFDSDGHGRNYRSQVINGFLEQVDLLMRAEGVILIGACNAPDRLDPAIRRRGRFDLHVEVPRPELDTIIGILKKAFDGPRHVLRPVARLVVGMTAAEVDALIREGRSLARSEGVSFSLDALRRMLIARGGDRSALERRIALHECGHAVVAHALGLGTVERILLTVDGGETHRRRRDTECRLDDLLAEITINLAGRAAERLVLRDISGGAGGDRESDLARATQTALRIDNVHGLGVHGPVWRGPAAPAQLTAVREIGRIRARLERAESRAGDILERNLAVLQAMAEALVRDRELAGAALRQWLAQVRREDVQPRRPVDRSQPPDRPDESNREEQNSGPSGPMPS